MSPWQGSAGWPFCSMWPWGPAPLPKWCPPFPRHRTISHPWPQLTELRYGEGALEAWRGNPVEGGRERLEGEGAPPSGGLLFLEKGQGRGSEAERWPVPSPLPTSSREEWWLVSPLRGRCVWQLGCPLCLTVVWRCSGIRVCRGEGLVSREVGGVPYLPQRGVISTLQKASVNLKGTQVLLWRGPQLPQLLKMPFTP